MLPQNHHIRQREMVPQGLKDFVIRVLNSLKHSLREKLVPYSKNPAVRYLVKTYLKHARKYLRMIAPLFGSTVMIALTYRCQCRCEYCTSGLYKQDRKEELRGREIMKLIDESNRLGARGIYFFGGEPLLVSELTDFIEYAKGKGLMVSLDTNGFLLDEDMVKKLKEADIDLIRVSIDSPFETIHDKFRGVNGIFKRAIAGIKYCKKYNIECRITTSTTKDKLKNGELEKTINLAKSLGVRVRVETPILSGKWLNRKDLVLSPEEIMLLRSFLKKDRVYWENESVNSKEIPFLCTTFVKEAFYISAYGDVQPCCCVPVSFGNIREESLRDIVKRMWNSDMFVNHEEYNDCPVNYDSFRKRYGKLLESEGQYPKRFKHYSPEND